MEGRLLETILKGGAGSGVLRPRLVTAGSGGPGHRPPGTTTWLRGARCTDPEAMPEMEARPPAENRHGGAPRGERPASWDAPRLTRADQSRLANATTNIVRLSALRPPLVGVDAKGKERTRAQQRAAGTNNTALFDIVNTATANGSLRAPRLRTRRARPHSRVPGERASASEDPGPRGDTTRSRDQANHIALALAARSRLSLRSPRDTSSLHSAARADLADRTGRRPFLVKRTHVAQAQHVGTGGANGSNAV